MRAAIPICLIAVGLSFLCDSAYYKAAVFIAAGAVGVVVIKDENPVAEDQQSLHDRYLKHSDIGGPNRVSGTRDDPPY